MMKNKNNVNSKTTVTPIITYVNASIDKSKIYIENKGKSGIYRWNSLITGKSYIGSSISLSNRLIMYYSSNFINRKSSNGSSAIYSAILKYGYSNFSLDIIEYCEPSILIKREQYYIDLLKPEYNILKIAGNRLGYKHSEETKIKIGINHRGENHHYFGKTLSYETRKKIGESLRSIVRINNKPRVVKLETRLKLSLRSKGVYVKIFNRSNELINEFSSMTNTAKYLGISIRTVGRYLDKDKTYNGLTFKSCDGGE